MYVPVFMCQRSLSSDDVICCVINYMYTETKCVPRVAIMKKKRMAHSCGAAIRERASGYTTNARPGPTEK